MATPINSPAQQLKDYRYRLWLARLGQLGIVKPKPYITSIPATRLLKLHPAFMRRMRFNVGDVLGLELMADGLHLIRAISPLEKRLVRLKQRGREASLPWRQESTA